MKKAFLYGLLILIALLAAAGFYIYSLKKKKIKVQPTYAEALKQADTSSFLIPLSVSLNDLENLANVKLGNVLFDGQFASRDGKDTVYLKIVRTDSIQFSFVNNKLRAVISMAAEASYKLHLVGNASKTFFKDKPLAFSFDAVLETPVVLMPDYGFNPKTAIKAIYWKKRPIIDVGVATIDLGDKIEETVFKNSKVITTKLDEVIGNKISLQKTLAQVWDKIQQPIRLSKSDDFSYYLREEPLALEVWLEPCRGDSLNAMLKLFGFMHIVHAKDTLLFTKQPLPKRIVISKQAPTDDTSRFRLNLLVPLEELEGLGNKKLVGKMLKYEDYSVEVKNIQITNGAKNILIKLLYDGDISGELQFKGYPELDMEQKKLHVKDLEFASENDDLIVDMADKVFHEAVQEKINEAVNIDMREMIDTIPQIIQNGIQKSKLASKADFVLQDFLIQKVTTHLTARYIQVQVSGYANLSIQLKREAIIKHDSIKKKRIRK